MKTELYRPPDPDQQLEEILADYLRAVEAGNPPDQKEVLACHPELADELAEFFANWEEMQRVTAPMRFGPGVNTPTARPRSTPELALGDVVQFGDYELLEEIARGGM